MTNKYAAIDFETFNEMRSSICAIGVVLYDGDKEVDSFYSLVNPQTRRTTYFCRKTHGLSYNDVKDYPIFPDVWEIVDKLIRGRKLIAHNAVFERCCINECNDEFDTPNDYEYIDTLKLCRQYLGLKCNKLDVVCKHLNIRLDHYHNALEDARACGQLFFKINEKYNIEL